MKYSFLCSKNIFINLKEIPGKLHQDGWIYLKDAHINITRTKLCHSRENKSRWVTVKVSFDKRSCFISGFTPLCLCPGEEGAPVWGCHGTTPQDFAGCSSGRGQMQADDGDPVKVLSLGPRSQWTRSRRRSGRPGMQSIRAGSDHLEGGPSSGRARLAPRRRDGMEPGHPGVGGGHAFTCRANRCIEREAQLPRGQSSGNHK